MNAWFHRVTPFLCQSVFNLLGYDERGRLSLFSSPDAIDRPQYHPAYKDILDTRCHTCASILRKTCYIRGDTDKTPAFTPLRSV